MTKTTATHNFELEHPITGVCYDFFMKAEETHDQGEWTTRTGDPGTPGTSSTRILDWGETETGERPDWVTRDMLDRELSKVDWD